MPFATLGGSRDLDAHWRAGLEVLYVPLHVRRGVDAPRESDPLTSVRLQLRFEATDPALAACDGHRPMRRRLLVARYSALVPIGAQHLLDRPHGDGVASARRGPAITAVATFESASGGRAPRADGCW